MSSTLLYSKYQVDLGHRIEVIIMYVLNLNALIGWSKKLILLQKLFWMERDNFSAWDIYFPQGGEEDIYVLMVWIP